MRACVFFFCASIYRANQRVSLLAAQGDATSMPAPAPRSRLSSGVAAGVVDGSPMDTGDVVDGVDFGAISAGMGMGMGSGKADDEGR